MDKEELYKYFIEENHTLGECSSFFNCTVGHIRVLLKKYDIKKEQEIKLDYNLLYDFYINNNHSLEETIEHFNISKTCLCSKLKKYHIKKEKRTFKRTEIDKEKMIEFYINQNLTIEETSEKLNCSSRILIRRLAEYNIKKPGSKRFENISNSLNDKYGARHPAQIKEFKEKMSKTNQERYGVPYACMREEYCKFRGSDSSINLNFAKKLDLLAIKYEREFVLENFKYDFKIDNILIELDPTITHNSTFSVFNANIKDSKYHLNKSILAKKYGYRCIHIWDWDDQDKIINNFLVPKEKIYARQCEIKNISKEVANEFLEKYHLQGKSQGNIVNISLFHNGEIVEIMTFGKPRYNKNYQWELLRLCSSKTVIGGSKKILKFFIDNYHPKNIISYCDLGKFDGTVYDNLGFTLIKKSNPCKHWYFLGKNKQNNIIHFTDNLLRQKGFDNLFHTNYGKGTSNEELMIENDFVKIYDCGQATYIWKYI